MTIATQDGVSYPLALPKDSLSVKLDLSCVGDEKNITDCITVGSEPAFVDQCKESGSKFIEVTCPGMLTLYYGIATFVQSLQWLVYSQ